MTSVNEKETLNVQEARAKLRESFLKAVTLMNGEACKILTCEQSTLEATFLGWKPDGTEIIVAGLKTPANINVASALLRIPDILAIHFDKSLELN